MTRSGEQVEFQEGSSAVMEPKFWEYGEGRVLAWNEFGDPDGKPVFYYHGWPSSRLQARFAHELALEKGLRLIAMDRPGMGKSTLVRGRELKDWPVLMAGFADGLGISTFSQIGVSGGGPYVLACAAMIPERLQGSVVLAGMVPLPFTQGGRRKLHPIYRMLIPLRKGPSFLFTMMFRVAARLSEGGPGRFPMSWLVHTLPAKDREILLGDPMVWEIATRSFSEGVSAKKCGLGAMVDADIYFQDPGFELDKVAHCIRYWHGGDDKNIPLELVEDLVGKMPCASLHVEPELGHFSLALLRAGAAMDELV